jgi:hypothetical protein
MELGNCDVTHAYHIKTIMLEQFLNAENSTKMEEFMTPWPSLHSIISTHSLDFWNNNINWGNIDGICGVWYRKKQRFIDGFKQDLIYSN